MKSLDFPCMISTCQKKVNQIYCHYMIFHTTVKFNEIHVRIHATLKLMWAEGFSLSQQFLLCLEFV